MLIGLHTCSSLTAEQFSSIIQSGEINVKNKTKTYFLTN